MANHKSAKKRIRQNETRRMSNKWKTSRVRTEIKKLRGLISNGAKEEAQKQFPVVQKLLAKLAKTSAMDKAAASRKTSRLATQVSKL
ncbi:MAG: 30S ribosomal protein S20 [Bacteriovoracaceae bacterium]|nr:30S ribosomal protein S20 [Halobacteriovoraceae bacterium]MDP7320397.1 30S ribosomal protein S20 [Bacteriovoracaceae bacterium]